MESPIIVAAGSLDDDMMDIGGYNIIELEPTQGGFQPKVMEWPPYVSQLLDKEVEDKRRAIYTAGGFQAVSRGEAPGTRTAYRAIVALQQADNTIHGPVNLRFKRSACAFMRKCWKQFKAYGAVPWLVTITGDEYAYLAEEMGYTVTARRITRDDLYIADEAFFTGTAAEVTPIREVDSRVIGSGKTGPITAKLQKAFFDIVNGRNDKYRDWLAPVAA